MYKNISKSQSSFMIKSSQQTQNRRKPSQPNKVNSLTFHHWEWCKHWKWFKQWNGIYIIFNGKTLKYVLFCKKQDKDSNYHCFYWTMYWRSQSAWETKKRYKCEGRNRWPMKSLSQRDICIPMLSCSIINNGPSMGTT